MPEHPDTRARLPQAAAWAVFALCVALSVVSVVYGWLSRSLDQSGASWSGGGPVAGALLVATVLAFPVAGVLIVTRRPENRIGWLLLAIGVGWGVSNATSYSDYALRLHHPLPGAAALAAIGSSFWIVPIGLMGTFLILLFPDGRLPGPRWRPVAWVSGTAIVIGIFAGVLMPGSLKDAGYPGTTNPYGVQSLATVVDDAKLAIILVPLMMVASAAALIVRFRRARGHARLQIKWLAAAAGFVAVSYLVVEMTSVILYPSSQHAPAWLIVLQTVVLLSFGLIPAAIGIAILRHRLFDIDLIVRRTLVYAVLVACLAGIYLAGVYAIEALVRSVSGSSSTVAVTLSTLAVALAFQPLRHRIQVAVDRRFYRAGYDAGRTLDAFSVRLRDQIDLDTLSSDVLAVVGEALHPAHAALWLRPKEGER
jgi:cytochrome b subunit of formate dehydrogenase